LYNTKNFNTNHVPIVIEKHNSIETSVYPAFSSWITQNQCPFVYSSKLDHTICPDLYLVVEDRRHESTSYSLLKDRSQLAIATAIVSIIYKAIRRMSGLQDAIISNCTTWY